MCGGVFDILHPGHAWFLKRAKSFGDELVVVIARDSTVKKLKGRPPILPEAQRRLMVSELRVVDKAVLGDEHDFINTLKRVNPNIIILGHDQSLPERVIEYCKAQDIRIERVGKLEGSLYNTSQIIKQLRAE